MLHYKIKYNYKYSGSWMDTHLAHRALSLHAAFLGSEGHLWQLCQICVTAAEEESKHRPRSQS